MRIYFDKWTQVTSELPWGVAKVFKDVLTLVSQEKAHLVHGADYRNGKPCLVNAVAQMTTAGGGAGIPMSTFGAVVSEFDRLNTRFQLEGVNDSTGYVSPLAAEILLTHFGEVKEPESAPDMFVRMVNNLGDTYVEPTDAEMVAALQEMMAPTPEEIIAPTNPIEQYTQEYVRDRLTEQG